MYVMYTYTEIVILLVIDTEYVEQISFSGSEIIIKLK